MAIEKPCGGGCVSSVFSVELEKYNYITENSIRFVKKNYCLKHSKNSKNTTQRRDERRVLFEEYLI